MNYTTLTGAKTVDGSIQQWINDSTVPASVILSEAEAWIYQFLRCREMRALGTGTIAATASTIDISSLNLLEPISFRRYGSDAGRIYLLDPQHFEERLSTQSDGSLDSGVPDMAMVLDNTIHLNVQADAAYTYRLTYYKPFPFDLTSMMSY